MNRSYEELEKLWQSAERGHSSEGRVHVIVTRASAAAMPKSRDKKSNPMHEQPERVRFSCANGLEGDRWKPGVDVDSQVSLTMLSVTQLVAGSPERYHLTGNNFIVDIDLSAANLPVGTRIQVGTGEIEISALPHDPCDRYIARFGQAAHDWVGDATHAERHLRGRLARITRDGEVGVGDVIRILR